MSQMIGNSASMNFKNILLLPPFTLLYLHLSVRMPNRLVTLPQCGFERGPGSLFPVTKNDLLLKMHYPARNVTCTVLL